MLVSLEGKAGTFAVHLEFELDSVFTKVLDNFKAFPLSFSTRPISNQITYFVIDYKVYSLWQAFLVMNYY